MDTYKYFLYGPDELIGDEEDPLFVFKVKADDLHQLREVISLMQQSDAGFEAADRVYLCEEIFGDGWRSKLIGDYILQHQKVTPDMEWKETPFCQYFGDLEKFKADLSGHHLLPSHEEVIDRFFYYPSLDVNPDNFDFYYISQGRTPEERAMNAKIVMTDMHFLPSDATMLQALEEWSSTPAGNDLVVHEIINWSEEDVKQVLVNNGLQNIEDPNIILRNLFYDPTQKSLSSLTNVIAGLNIPEHVLEKGSGRSKAKDSDIYLLNGDVRPGFRPFLLEINLTDEVTKKYLGALSAYNNPSTGAPHYTLKKIENLYDEVLMASLLEEVFFDDHIFCDDDEFVAESNMLEYLDHFPSSVEILRRITEGSCFLELSTFKDNLSHFDKLPGFKELLEETETKQVKPQKKGRTL